MYRWLSQFIKRSDVKRQPRQSSLAKTTLFCEPLEDRAMPAVVFGNPFLYLVTSETPLANYTPNGGPTFTLSGPTSGIVTNINPTVSGSIASASGADITQLQAQVDGGALVNVTLGANNTFSFTSALPLNGTADGLHTITLRATDSLGRVNTQNVTFTLDTVAPNVNLTLAVASDTGTVGDNQTTLSSITLNGATEGNSTITLTNNQSAGNLTTISLANGSFSLGNVALTLVGNATTNTTYTATVTDAAGNVGTANLTISRVPDFTAPTLNAVLTSGTPTNNPLVNGNVTDLSGIAIFRGNVDSVNTATATNLLGDLNANGSFTLNFARLQAIFGGTLSDGPHFLFLEAIDPLGNSSTQTINFTLDTQAPNGITFDFAPGFDTGTLGDRITTLNTVNFTGTTSAGANVTLGNTNQTVVADGSGNFTFTGVPLTVGTTAFNVVAVDGAGNNATFSQNFTLTADTIGPVIAGDLTNDTGSSATDNITSNSAFNGSITDVSGIGTFLASIDGGATVDVSGDVLANGTFAFDQTRINTINGGALGQGSHTLTLTASDRNGTTSAAFTFNFQFDTVDPATPTLDLTLASDTGTVGDQDTSLSTVTLAGTTEANATLTLTGANFTTLTTTAAANGAFSFANVPLAILGANELTVTASDVAGNSADLTRTFTRSADLAAPVFAPLSLANDTGAFANDGITMNATINGSVSDPSFVTLLAGFGANATVDISNLLPTTQGGAFTLNQATLDLINGNVTLPDGAFTLTLLATDALGNNATTNLTFTLDREAPEIIGYALDFTSRSNLTDGFNTTFNPVDLGGTTDEANATLTAVLGAQNITATADANGTFQIENLTLSFGSNNVSLTATDLAGNVSPALNQTFSLTADLVAPVIAASLTQDTGVSNSDSITSNATVNGTVTDASAIASFFAGFDGNPINFDVSSDLLANGTFAFDATRIGEINGGALSQGNHTLRLIAVDSEGNTSPTFNLTFQFDTTPPAVAAFDLDVDSDTGTVGDQTTIGNSVTLSGTTDPGASVTLQSNNLTVTAAANGSFSFQNVPLTVGNNNFTVTATDVAGNVGVAFERTIVRSNQAIQIVTGSPAASTIAANGTLTLPTNYTTDNPVDATLTGLALRMHYNSSAVTFGSLSSLFATGFIASQDLADTSDFDNDVDTDRFVLTQWADLGGNWPGALPQQLYVGNFTGFPGFTGSTTIRFTASSTAAGFQLFAPPVIINFV